MNNDSSQTTAVTEESGGNNASPAEKAEEEKSGIVQENPPESGEDELFPPENDDLSRIPERCRGWLTSVAPVTVPPSRMLASPEQLTDNFLALLESIHDEDALNLLELRHWWQFGSRRRMRKELHLLYAGLWHLALHRSFPQNYEVIFQVWREREARHMSRSRRTAWEKRLQQYVDAMIRYGDRDFTGLSRHMALQVYNDRAKVKRLAFGLALHIRKIYTFLFEHLV